MSPRFQCAGFVLAVLCFAAAPAAAQSTVSLSDFQAMYGRSITVTHHDVPSPSAAQVNALKDLTGANRNWDFTGLNFVAGAPMTVRYVSPTTGLPGAAGFVGADVAMVDDVRVDSSYYMYSDVRADGVYIMGSVATSGAENFTSNYAPALISFPLPMAFGTTWTGQSTLSMTVDGSAVEIGENVSGNVDGWGTVKLPNGTFNCLRYRVESQQNMMGFLTTSTAYHWLLPGFGDAATVMVISQTLPFVGTITNYAIGYSVMTGQSGVAIEPVDTAIPSGFELLGNYPNPFNPTTLIRFALPESGQVLLEVFDPVGVRVATLVNGSQAAGTYEVPFVADGLPSGLYLVRMSSGGLVSNRGITLLR